MNYTDIKRERRVLIDLSHIKGFFHAGIYNAAIDMVKGFIQFSHYDIVLLIWENQVEYIDKWVGVSCDKILLPLSQQKFLTKKFKIGFCPAFLEEQLDKHCINIVFTTCFTIESYIFPKRFHQVGVVYDMQPFMIGLRGGRILYAFYYLFFSLLYYHLIDNIITISNHTKNEVRKYSGRNSQVVYLSLNSIRMDSEEKPIDGLEKIKYILDVNSFERYKNAEILIESYAKIKDKIPHVLYLKGYRCNEERYNELLEYIKSLGLEGRVILDISNRTEAEMLYLFRHASLFVSPSLREGFGFTPIEAAICKIPIIVSDIETHAEVTEGKVPRFNPHSVEEISQTMLTVLSNPPSYEDLTSISQRYIEKYSLENQIKSYDLLLDSLLIDE